MLDAERKDATPISIVKRSKKTPRQQRGLDWLTAAGKAHFEKTYDPKYIYIYLSEVLCELGDKIWILWFTAVSPFFQ